MRKLLLAFCLIPGLVLADPPKNEYKMTMVEKPEARLTKNWAFVFDTSHSMEQDRIKKAHYAFLQATKFPTDHLNFCVYTFNDKGVDRFKDWQQASKNAFEEAHKWSNKPWQRGVLSFADNAIKKALRQKKKDLTVIIITDGGFTRNSNGTDGTVSVKQVIEEGQAWRVKNGYGQAIITTIGIQNLFYRNGYKKPDPICQRGLREIGVKGKGGYFYVHKGSYKPSLIAPTPEKVTVIDSVKDTIKGVLKPSRLRKVKSD